MALHLEDHMSLDQQTLDMVQEMYRRNHERLTLCEQALLFCKDEREIRTCHRTHAQLSIVGACLHEVPSADVLPGIRMVAERIYGICERFVLPIAKRNEEKIRATESVRAAYEFLQCEGYCGICGHESQTLDDYKAHKARGHATLAHEPADAFDVPGNE